MKFCQIGCEVLSSFDQCCFEASSIKSTTVAGTIKGISNWEGRRCNHPAGFHSVLRGLDENGQFVKEFDNRHLWRQKTYLQCLLTLGAILERNEEVRSNQPIAYYKLLISIYFLMYMLF